MLKRLMDLVLAGIALVILAPAFLIIALVIKRDSKGPVYYRGVRTGLNGVPFKIFKFRTMVSNAEALGGPSTAHNDTRLTKTGRFLRKYKLDEIPQFMNVIRGQMSLVGPRPQVEHYTQLYNEEELVMLSVKPGIVDYATLKFINLDQILGDEDVDNKYRLEIEPEKNRLRIKYAKEHTLWMDCKILFQMSVGLLKIRSLWNTRNLA